MSSQDNAKQEYASMFHARPRYVTQLPPLPATALLLQPETPYLAGHVGYRATGLEQEWPYEYLTRWDVGGGGFPPVSLGPFDAVAGMRAVERPPLDERDVGLLGEHAKELGVDGSRLPGETKGGGRGGTGGLSIPKRNVTWMRRTQYIAAERGRPLHGRSGATDGEGSESAGSAQATGVDASRAGQVRWVEESFRRAKEWDMEHPPVHPTNPSLKATSVMSLLPEADLDDLSLCIVEGEPGEVEPPMGEQGPLGRAILRPKQDPGSKEKLLMTVYVPREGAGVEEEVEGEEVYTWLRDYAQGGVATINATHALLTLREEEGEARWGILQSRLELRRRPNLGTDEGQFGGSDEHARLLVHTVPRE